MYSLSTVLVLEKYYIKRCMTFILILIQYHNPPLPVVFSSDIEYFYHVHHIPNMDYNTKQVLHFRKAVEDESQERILRKRYGIRIEFEQAGRLGEEFNYYNFKIIMMMIIGMFSFSTLLLKLASGMGLITLTTTTIDCIALYLLPNRKKYYSRVFEEDRKKTT